MSEEVLKKGMEVVVATDFGTGPVVTVKIRSFGVKNGRPLFGYIDKEGNERWAYNSQIIRIVEVK